MGEKRDICNSVAIKGKKQQVLQVCCMTIFVSVVMFFLFSLQAYGFISDW